FDWQRLLRRGVEDYEIRKSNMVKSFLAPRGVMEVVDQLRGWGNRFAITGSLAAARFAPAAPTRMAAVYVESIAGAAEVLGLRDVAAGANALPAQPSHLAVLDRPPARDGLGSAAASP